MRWRCRGMRGDRLLDWVPRLRRRESRADEDVSNILGASGEGGLVYVRRDP